MTFPARGRACGQTVFFFSNNKASGSFQHISRHSEYLGISYRTTMESIRGAFALF